MPTSSFGLPNRFIGVRMSSSRPRGVFHLIDLSGGLFRGIACRVNKDVDASKAFEHGLAQSIDGGAIAYINGLGKGGPAGGLDFAACRFDTF